MGIGGGLIMAPLLLFAPQVFHASALPIKAVVGLTMTQDLVGSFSAALMHSKYKRFHSALVLHMGTFGCVGALTGGVLSFYAASRQIFMALAVLVTIAAGSMFIYRPSS